MRTSSVAKWLLFVQYKQIVGILPPRYPARERVSSWKWFLSLREISFPVFLISLALRLFEALDLLIDSSRFCSWRGPGWFLEYSPISPFPVGSSQDSQNPVWSNQCLHCPQEGDGRSSRRVSVAYCCPGGFGIEDNHGEFIDQAVFKGLPVNLAIEVILFD